MRTTNATKLLRELGWQGFAKKVLLDGEKATILRGWLDLSDIARVLAVLVGIGVATVAVAGATAALFALTL